MNDDDLKVIRSLLDAAELAMEVLAPERAEEFLKALASGRPLPKGCTTQANDDD